MYSSDPPTRTTAHPNRASMSDADYKRTLLESLSEKDFTKTVICPLLSALGFTRVEYSHGPNEQGADVLAIRPHVLGDLELTAIQVKKVKPNRRANSSANLNGLLIQLKLAAHTEFSFSTGFSSQPHEVWFCTPYRISTDVINDLTKADLDERRPRLTVLDGDRIVTLCHQHRPEILRVLEQYPDQVASRALNTLRTNQQFANAMRYPRAAKDIRSIETNIDLFIGRPSTELLMQRTILPVVETIQCTLATFSTIRQVNDLTSSRLGIPIISTPSAQLSRRVSGATKSLNDRKTALAAIDTFESTLRLCAKILDDNRDSVAGKAARQRRDRVRQTSTQFRNLVSRQPWFSEEKDKWHPSRDFLNELTDLAHDLQKQNTVSVRSMADSIQEVVSQARSIASHFRIVRRFGEEGKLFPVEINLSSIADSFKEERDAHIGAIAKFNSGNADSRTAALAALLDGAREFADRYEPVLSQDWIAQFCEDAIYEHRILATADDVFKTERSTLLLGAAGSGKTTALRLYALRQHESDSECIPFYIPLVHLAEEWRSTKRAIPTWRNEHEIADPILRYLIALDVDVSENELESRFRRGDAVLLFDGLDEAAREAPWLGNWIHACAEAWPQCQLVVSSRIIGDYAAMIPFQAVTMLPFTDEQLKAFIKRWLTESRHSGAVLRHLDRHESLKEIVRTPLLASVLCTLAENDVPLPSSELKLYGERLRLLLGDFDREKGACRIQSDRDVLVRLARRVAFWFHQNEIREHQFDEVETEILRWYGHNKGGKSSVLALHELVDPCNVFVPMVGQGSYGFDHLRYQEYLAAEYFVRNRSAPLRLDSPWWRDVMIMAAQMSDDMVPELKKIVSKMSRHDETTIVGMINVRPIAERDEIARVASRECADVSWIGRLRLSTNTQSFLTKVGGIHFVRHEN